MTKTDFSIFLPLPVFISGSSSGISSKCTNVLPLLARKIILANLSCSSPDITPQIFPNSIPSLAFSGKSASVSAEDTGRSALRVELKVAHAVCITYFSSIEEVTSSANRLLLSLKPTY